MAADASRLSSSRLPILQHRVRSKRISATEVMRATLARAEKAQAQLNCFITICADRRCAMPSRPTRRWPGARRSARCTACRSTSRTSSTPRACAPRSPPTCTSTMCRRQDSVCVARLKQAGAILMGKTTTPEFGHMPYTEAPLFGRTRNAWAADRTSGGSSGGAAVAVAAGVCPIGIGTDAGGSTRIPAAANGVVGFKQSVGRGAARHVAGGVRQHLQHQPDGAHGDGHGADAGGDGRPASLRSLFLRHAVHGLRRCRPSRGLAEGHCALPGGR